MTQTNYKIRQVNISEVESVLSSISAKETASSVNLRKFVIPDDRSIEIIVEEAAELVHFGIYFTVTFNELIFMFENDFNIVDMYKIIDSYKISDSDLTCVRDYLMCDFASNPPYAVYFTPDTDIKFNIVDKTVRFTSIYDSHTVPLMPIKEYMDKHVKDSGGSSGIHDRFHESQEEDLKNVLKALSDYKITVSTQLIQHNDEDTGKLTQKAKLMIDGKYNQTEITFWPNRRIVQLGERCYLHYDSVVYLQGKLDIVELSKIINTFSGRIVQAPILLDEDHELLSFCEFEKYNIAAILNTETKSIRIDQMDDIGNWTFRAGALPVIYSEISSYIYSNMPKKEECYRSDYAPIYVGDQRIE